MRGLTVVAGLGASGLACLRHLVDLGVPAAATDTRAAPPGLDEACRLVGVDRVRCNGLDSDWLLAAERVVVSPGLSLAHPALRAARAAGVPLVGELALFAEALAAGRSATVLAVTGSNGKSTVTSLLGAMLCASGRATAVGGNLGPAALSLLPCAADAVECYVLEVSSFQLETAAGFRADAAVVLNLSADHLDRHGSLHRYAAIKRRVFAGGGVMVLNADDPWVRRMRRPGRQVRWFGSAAPAAPGDCGVVRIAGEDWLVAGDEPLLPGGALRLRGRHNLLNAAAALAMAEAVGADRSACLAALREFVALPHRMETISDRAGVLWVNDSKATNVAATLAAVQGLDRPCILLAGGVGKGQDFQPLATGMPTAVKAVILYGEDAPLMAGALVGRRAVSRAADLSEAVRLAAAAAQAGDVVLLSPACASFDQYANFVERGEHFRRLVTQMLTEMS
jgi:UDP-N-acetylmuramoylalanine--D-glutamate ligase